MLKKIPDIISPDLLYALAQMGHGDDIAIVDANFPATSHAQRLIRADASNSDQLLSAILQLMPVDDFTDDALRVMAMANGELPAIAQDFSRICQFAEEKEVLPHGLSRQDFYQQAKNAFCIVATSERRLYANCLIRKGVVPPGSSQG